MVEAGFWHPCSDISELFFFSGQMTPCGYVVFIKAIWEEEVDIQFRILDEDCFLVIHPLQPLNKYKYIYLPTC